MLSAIRLLPIFLKAPINLPALTLCPLSSNNDKISDESFIIDKQVLLCAVLYLVLFIECHSKKAPK